MLEGRQIEMWQVPLATKWLDKTLDKLTKDATITAYNFEDAMDKETVVFMKSLETAFIDAMNTIKGRLKKKSNKGVTIVKKSQIIAYCRELGIPFEGTTKALLNNGIICKYSKNNKDYPYRFNRRV